MENKTDKPEIGRLISSKDHDYPFYFDGNHFVSLGDNPIRLDSIRSDGDFYTEPTYVSKAYEELMQYNKIITELFEQKCAQVMDFGNRIAALELIIQRRDEQIGDLLGLTAP